jgi:hypothetical protein
MTGTIVAVVASNLLTYPTALVALVLIVATTAATLAALVVVQRFIPSSLLREQNDVAGFLFSGVGVLYAVLLAFVVIAVWEQFGRAEDIVRTEVSAADALYQDVGVYPSAVAGTIRSALLRYANDTIVDEWPKMQTGLTSDAAEQSLTRLTTLAESVVPTNQREQLIYADTLTLLHTLLEQRDERLQLNSRGIPAIMWRTMIAGGVITLSFTLFFGASNFRIHLFLSGLMAAVVAVMFVLIIELNFPFRGDTSVTSDAWSSLVTELHRHPQLGEETRLPPGRALLAGLVKPLHVTIQASSGCTSSTTPRESRATDGPTGAPRTVVSLSLALGPA